jgi:hypothetical protein
MTLRYHPSGLDAVQGHLSQQDADRTGILTRKWSEEHDAAVALGEEEQLQLIHYLSSRSSVCIETTHWGHVSVPLRRTDDAPLWSLVGLTTREFDRESDGSTDR